MNRFVEISIMHCHCNNIVTIFTASFLTFLSTLCPAVIQAKEASSDIIIEEPLETSKEEKLPIADLQRFTKVIEYIQEYYVKPVGDNVLFENAMRGMLTGLDPHSSYLDKEEFAELKANTTGKFGGLGVEVLPEDGFIRVISVLDENPAQRAGVWRET